MKEIGSRWSKWQCVPTSMLPCVFVILCYFSALTQIHCRWQNTMSQFPKQWKLPKQHVLLDRCMVNWVIGMSGMGQLIWLTNLYLFLVVHKDTLQPLVNFRINIWVWQAKNEGEEGGGIEILHAYMAQCQQNLDAMSNALAKVPPSLPKIHWIKR